MSLPLAHALVGASLGVALWPERRPGELTRAVATGALLGVCPDIDFALGWVHLIGWGWHHGLTHSIAFAVTIGVIAARVLGLRGGRGALCCVLAAVSHPVMDFLTTQSAGVALAWPISGHRYKLGIEAASYYELAFGGGSRIARLIVAELVLFGPWLVLALMTRGRRLRAVRSRGSADSY